MMYFINSVWFIRFFSKFLQIELLHKCSHKMRVFSKRNLWAFDRGGIDFGEGKKMFSENLLKNL
jgi:hypothetical protein